MKHHKIKVGDKIGNISVIGETEKREKNGARFLVFRCFCGKEFVRSTAVIRNSINKGMVINCGCYNRKIMSRNGKIHNTATDPDRREKALQGMKQFEETCICQLQRKKVNRNSSTGIRGVSYATKSKHLYRVRLNLRRKEIFLGYADTLDEAIKIRQKGEERFYMPVIEKYEEGEK